MWDTALTDYKVTNTPYGKDILKILADACHKRKFPLCVYYSIADMNCKYYPNSGKAYELPCPEDGDEPDIDKYTEFMKAQVRELCTNYGKIHGFWWDAHMIGLNDETVNNEIRKLQPGIIINNRGLDSGDFSTPEREYDVHDHITTQPFYNKPTEACESMGKESWGYRINEDYFSVRYLTGSIDKHMAKGGNYLLNIGPGPDGEFSPEAIRILARLGNWYGKVKESFLGAKPVSGLTENESIIITGKDKELFVHCTGQLNASGIALENLNILPESAVALNNGASLNYEIDMMPSLFKAGKTCLHIYGIPVDELAGEAIIIKLTFAKDIEQRGE